MYRTCIFCSGKLGSNESIKRFPVGRALAFDAAKGRLWAVCPKCARWNLAPIEERWEAIEEAERQFRDTRLRAQSENVGLAKLRDGTRLVRVGAALPGELAAWRYGREMRKRAIRARAALGVTLAGAAVVVFGGSAIPAAAGLLTMAQMVGSFYAAGEKFRRADRLAYHIPTTESPTGWEIRLRWRDLAFVRTGVGDDGRLELVIPIAKGLWAGRAPVTVTGGTAVSIMGMALVRINGAGARRTELDLALDRLESAGGTEPYLLDVAAKGYGLEVPGLEYGEMLPTLYPNSRKALQQEREARIPRPLPLMQADSTAALALEMALHEESERRALEGDLAELEAMWREAEEIAAIADALPGTPNDEAR